MKSSDGITTQPTPRLTVLVLSFFAAFNLAALNATSAYAEDNQKLMGEAKAYLQQGNVKAAIIQLKNALQENPDDKEARLMLIMAHITK